MDFSRLMLGTVQFGLNYGIANADGKPRYETARSIVQTASENGINCLDTAAAYGDSETVLGRVLAELELRDKMRVISKVPCVSRQCLSDGEAERFIVESVENSLTRLGVKRLAVCMFHAEEDIRYLNVLRDLKRQGLIGDPGISLDSNRYCNEALDSGIEYVQLPYNILEKRFDDFLCQSGKNGINVFTRSVYLQGLLLMPEENISGHLRNIIPVRRELTSIAAESGMDMAELCMRFVLSNPDISSVLVGVDNPGQLQHNLALQKKGILPADLIEKIRTTVPTLEENIIRPFLWNKTA